MTEEKIEIRKWHFSDGKISKEISCINGIPHGLTRGYQEHNGALAYEINYNKGREEGLSRSFYEDGKVSVESNYVNGRPQGTSSMWFRNGNLSNKSYQINGLHVGEQIYLEY
jgi:antitoxin component YwqK of YwqJK toxin-antitoxin module